ncbi:MAG TPA: DUF488 domain-containing protein [Longimicrobiales bacterium]|nr:DUF488 domain-containing protein [Longimicrobiales bacterium]
MARIYTIGHSTRSIDEFVELLRAHGVDTLVDVRRHPGSRRQPQFGRDTLPPALEAAGIAYRHEEELGGRRAPAPDSPNGWWRNEQFRGYADHMATPGFQAALDRLIERAERETQAIMCAEAVPWRCHRSLTADALVARGVDVAHIVGPGRAEPHLLNPAARVGAGGSVTYPPEQSSLF